jgi:cyclic nucleotide-binding protein
MVLDWFSGSKEATIEDLIAKKKYAKAIQLLRSQFHQGSRDPRLRIQLADVLILAVKPREAVPILVGVADEFAREGFAAKAIAVLKRIEKIEPGRADVATQLASLIGTKPVTAPKGPVEIHEIGAEEIGIVDAASPSGDVPAGAIEIEPEPEAGETAADDEFDLTISPDDATMSEEAFGKELLAVARRAMKERGPATSDTPTAAAVAPSPLFGDFSGMELVAVMRGLHLLSFDPGDIVITEGEPGDSLFVLTTGTVKAFVKNPAGRHIQVREMSEGEFFGEISILTGKPRTATVTAASRCELLELDRANLDAITKAHPRVRQILEEFCQKRQGSADEALVRGMKFGQ